MFQSTQLKQAARPKKSALAVIPIHVKNWERLQGEGDFFREIVCIRPAPTPERRNLSDQVPARSNRLFKTTFRSYELKRVTFDTGNAMVGQPTGSSRARCATTRPNEPHLFNSVRPHETGAKLRKAHCCHQAALPYVGEATRIVLRCCFINYGSATPRFAHALPRYERSAACIAGRSRLGVPESRKRGFRLARTQHRLTVSSVGRSAQWRVFP